MNSDTCTNCNPITRISLSSPSPHLTTSTKAFRSLLLHISTKRYPITFRYCCDSPHKKYYILVDPQNNPFKSFLLYPLPVPVSHFFPLFDRKSPPFLLSPYSPPFKRASYFHLHPDSSSLPYFSLTYTPFNLSLFVFVNLHTSVFCSLVPSSQYLLPRSLYSAATLHLSSFCITQRK